jgi:hypothetical protein
VIAVSNVPPLSSPPGGLLAIILPVISVGLATLAFPTTLDTATRYQACKTSAPMMLVMTSLSVPWSVHARLLAPVSGAILASFSIGQALDSRTACGCIPLPVSSKRG